MVNLTEIYKTDLIKIIFLFALLTVIPFAVRADSPLTSTPFHDKYTDVDIVLKAEQTGGMTREFADYLHDSSNPDDVKAALINALGWSTEGKTNAEMYKMFLKHKKNLTENDIVELDANELFVIGYLMAMDNYFDSGKALIFLKQARKKKQSSYTYSIIEALVKAQIAMEKDFCKAWKYTNKVFSNKSLVQDMREDARKIIYDYMILYKNDCGKK